MSIVQLLAEVGADASLINDNVALSELAEKVESNSKIWCALFPEKDGEEQEEQEEKKEEDKTELNLH